MPAPKKRTTKTETVEETSPDTVEIIDGSEDETPEDLALAGFLSEMRGNAEDIIANVYRASGKGKRLGFMFAFSPDEMTGGELMEKIRDEYGPGEYRVHVRQGEGLIANRPITIAEKLDKPEAMEEKADAFGPREFIALMQSQAASQQQMFAQTMAAFAEVFKGAQSQQPAVDPVAMQNSVLQGMVTLKQLSEDGKKPDVDPVQLLIKGIELSQNLAPKTGETNTTDVLLKGLEMFPMLAKAGETKHPMMPGPGQGHTNPPTGIPPHKSVHSLKAPEPEYAKPNTPRTAETGQPQQPDENEMFMLQAKANLAFLCKQAQGNKDPSLYAELILDQMGEQQVMEFIGKPDALDTLAKIEPGVAVYQGWFLALRTAILELTTDENQEHGDAVPDDETIFEAEETPDPATVVARIDDSGIRREGRKGASVTIPDADPVTIDGGDGDPSSDT